MAPRCTGICSACATIRPRGSKRAVEQSRRSLMFAEKAERTRTAPISSATARSALPRTWSSIFTLPSRSRYGQRAISIPIPHPPWGDPRRGSLELDHSGALHVEGGGRGEDELGARAHFGGSEGDELHPAAGVGVAVPLVVSAVERFRQPRLQRHGQLERLALVA